MAEITWKGKPNTKKGFTCQECGAWVRVGAGELGWKPGPGGYGGRGSGKTGGRYVARCVSHSKEVPSLPGPITPMPVEPIETPSIPKIEPRPEPSGTVESALRSFVEGIAARSVDSEQVEKIAREVALSVVSERERPVIDVRVTRPDSEPITISGAHKALPEVLIAAMAGPVMLVGPAGCGKTTLAEHVAESLGRAFRMNGAIASEYKLTGFVDAGGAYHSTPFRDAFENGAVYLFDELDSSAPSALLAFNSALANGHSDFPDQVEPIARHEGFIPLAAANTWGMGADREYVGRNQLDAATLDRFTPIVLDYDRAIEQSLAGPHGEYLALVWRVRDRVNELKMRHVVSTRAIIRGRTMLEQGMAETRVAELLLRRNLGLGDWERVSR